MKTLILLSLVSLLAACEPPMRGTKVSDLPLATLPLDGTEYVMVVQDGKSVRVPLAALIDHSPPQ